MKLDKFINRPVLSTVISILIVILGVLGLVSLPCVSVSGYCSSYYTCEYNLYGSECPDRFKQCDRSFGRAD